MVLVVPDFILCVGFWAGVARHLALVALFQTVEKLPQPSSGQWFEKRNNQTCYFMTKWVSLDLIGQVANELKSVVMPGTDG